MTVCITAICEGGKNIISVTDQMIGFLEGDKSTKVDGAVLKDDHIHPNWFAAFAADDTTDVSPIMDRAKLMMCDGGRQRTLSEAAMIFQESFMARHQQLIEFAVLKPLGFKGYEDFHQRAKDCLPEMEHTRILQKIETIAPQCAFLVAGFDPTGIGHLFMQEAKAAWLGLDELGWWSIGSGCTEAVTALEWYAKKFGFSIASSEAHAIYCLLAAKFMAEANDLVGYDTILTSHIFDHPIRYMAPLFIDRIRSEWTKIGNARIPKRLISQIPLMLKTYQETEELIGSMDSMLEKSRKPRRGRKRGK